MAVEFKDRTLRCKDCNSEFIFTSGEQAFYATKGFVNDPARCGSCRTARKKTAGAGPRPDLALQEVVCADCGQQTQVPFVPRQGRPVYCRQCLDRNRAALG